ncbi:MAG: hypothetical protein V1769_00405 [Thermoplasmatota archaeon]
MKCKAYCDSAVAGVIEALLLVALAAIVLSTIQLVYIPDIMEQKESEHMDEVDNQFSYLKSVIDLQSALQEDVPISSPITLGSTELPYFVTARAFGQLDIVEVTSSKVDTDFASNIPLNSIQLDAMNSYFIDQLYVLEGGAVLVQQNDGESVRIEPSLTIQNQSSQIRITWQLPRFTSIAGKNSTSGYKNCFIRTNYTSDITYAGTTTYIYIYSQFLDAWNATFNDVLEEAVANGYINVQKYPVADPTYLRIIPGTKSIYLDLTMVTIGAQIGPGVVVNQN